MILPSQRKKQKEQQTIDDFIFDWNRFSIDLWWRKRYNIPFGSPQHRRANFIDMLIEYRETILLYKKNEFDDENIIVDNETISFKDDVKMTKDEIIEEYENLDLSQFDEKE